uniref:AlNc14C141G7246 protein n=1 Tax=Albugo laibachii Nc14 TaxID=890382 RepID=F0WL58_9STRA|nr:AlNc14C141G7246 [Albugo laibachii Nc14]|eukprot:CCA22019.1 AlNc14C141G7246 [Albugo laibachii Nc14]
MQGYFKSEVLRSILKVQLLIKIFARIKAFILLLTSDQTKLYASGLIRSLPKRNSYAILAKCPRALCFNFIIL